jgi:threonine/homoserine/homoserine lactone efflux protein
VGIACGAGALGATLLVAISIAPGDGWDRAGRLLGAALLGWLAFSAVRQPTPGQCAPVVAKGDGMAAFGAGFLTALTNPMTAAYFASQFLVGEDAATIVLAPIVATAMALLYFLMVAALLARPAFRKASLIWYRPVRLVAATVFVAMAVSLLRSVL